jgi:hypothetical protein
LAVIHAPAFVVRHPEGLVAAVVKLGDVYRSIGYESELVQLQNGERGRNPSGYIVVGGKRLRIDRIVTDGLEENAVDLVRSPQGICRSVP